jgi:hypothetical protein
MHPLNCDKALPSHHRVTSCVDTNHAVPPRAFFPPAEGFICAFSQARQAKMSRRRFATVCLDVLARAYIGASQTPEPGGKMCINSSQQWSVATQDAPLRGGQGG